MSSRYDERFGIDSDNTKQFKFGIYATGIAKYNGCIEIFPRKIYI